MRLLLLLLLLSMHRSIARLHRPFGLALDIDGVLLRGSTAIPRAAEALTMLAEARVPHIFMTNGGGVLEAAKAQELSDKLGCEVSEDQILLSHTPMRGLVDEYRDKWIMVLGHKDYVNVARAYGFNKVTTVDEVFARFPSMIPFMKPKEGVVPWPGDIVDAAMVFYDPIDWYVEMQILCDVLQGGHPNSPNNAKQIPFYASNPDFIFSSNHPKPRFAQGAFTQAVSHLYKQYTQQDLQVQYFGKPTKVQYSYAETLIKRQCQKLGIPTPAQFYGIGDNPHADVRGANNAGNHWSSILVCTGIFQGTPSDNDPTDKADRVEFDVFEAVKRLLSTP